MRVILLLGGVLTAVAVAPAPAAAGTCDDQLSSCLTRTVLFGTPEDWDIVGCQVDYTLCLATKLRFS